MGNCSDTCVLRIKSKAYKAPAQLWCRSHKINCLLAKQENLLLSLDFSDTAFVSASSVERVSVS